MFSCVASRISSTVQNRVHRGCLDGVYDGRGLQLATITINENPEKNDRKNVIRHGVVCSVKPEGEAHSGRPDTRVQ